MVNTKKLIETKRALKKIDKTMDYVVPNIRKKKETYKGYKGNPNHIIFLPDQHEPFCKEGYLEWTLELQKKYNAGQVLMLGDESDQHSLSAYSFDPDGLSPGDEIYATIQALKEWYKAYPVAKVCISNHGARIYRKAKEVGLPKGLIKSMNEIFEAPKTWQWADSWEIHNVHFCHGNGSSGPQAAIKRAVLNQISTVIGHIHSECSVQWSVSKKHRLFGVIAGSGLDDSSYAAAYAKDHPRKSVISAGVVLDRGSLPIVELMPL